MQKDKGTGPKNLIDRKQVALMCRCSIGVVRYWERQGLLLPKLRDENGKYWYDPSHVAASNLKRVKTRPNDTRRAGALAASVYAGLRAGQHVRDLVIELAEPPEVVEELAVRYAGSVDTLVTGRLVDELGALLESAGYQLVWSEFPTHVARWIALEKAEAARAVASAVVVKASAPLKTRRRGQRSTGGSARRSARGQ